MGQPCGEAFDGLVEVDALLIGERGHPGDHVAELVDLLLVGALAHRLSQFTDLLGQPRHGRRDATRPVPVGVGPLDHVLQVGEVHALRR